jgi:uncharacterized membrane protein SpoIIM required for sporulation
MREVTERSFVERRQTDWLSLEACLGPAVMQLSPRHVATLAQLYRNACSDLARAEAAQYSAPLVTYLQELVARAHARIYDLHAREKRQRTVRLQDVRATLTSFAVAVRRHRVAVGIAAFMFFGPFIFAAIYTWKNPAFATNFMQADDLRNLAEAYAEGFEGGRAFGTDAQMTGFYVNNNVGIALRCFALGVFGGFGSAVYLLYNGLSTGTVFGYVTASGSGANIATFTIGHSAFELGAIVIAGAAGLALGWAFVSPGELARSESVRRAGKSVLTLVMGAAVMLLFAAVIEGFWSSSSIPAEVKRAVGVGNLLLVVSYFTFAGRQREA